MSARPYPALAAAGVATAVATLLLLLAAALPPTPIDAATPGRGWANRANALAGMAIFWAGFAGAAVGALGRWHGVRQEATRAGLVLVALLPPLIGASAIAVAGLSVTLPSGLAFGLIASVPTAICYAIVRLLAVAIGAWNRLRTRRLLWALTHAQLVVAIVLAFVTATVLVIVDAQGRLSTTNGTTLVAEIVIEVLPGILAIGVVSVLLFGAIVPPVAAISYVVLRRVTRRIDNLVDTTAALRSGKLETRTPVDGEDEIGRLQADFNAMADELERLVRETEGQRDTLQRLLTERRELVAAVSHELRTPVATMAAALESALAHDDPTALRQDLALLASETARLGRLIDDLFTLARAELGQLPLTIEPLDPAALLSRCVHVAAPLAWQHGRVEVVCETPPGLPPVLADAGRLEQIVHNLIGNAVRHTPPGGIVLVRAATEPGWVILTVRDTGDGIAPEDLPRIWDRFYRSDAARDREHGGAGLGLALVKELSEAMGGEVAVTSAPGDGACFTVRLPAA